VNDEIVHGIPGDRKIKAGDLVSLDFGVQYQGYYGDAAVTVAVGEVAPRARKLMETTETALYAGIRQAKVGRRLSDISHAVQGVVEDAKFGVSSSRFWEAEKYSPGKSQPSFDKQPLRDWLTESGWDKEPPAPELPPKIVEETSKRYREAYRRLTGKEL